jgi:hypothetical protein
VIEFDFEKAEERIELLNTAGNRNVRCPFACDLCQKLGLRAADKETYAEPVASADGPTEAAAMLLSP